jgi:2,3-dihydroxybiphenyl 1,2-dioxygenase
MSGVVALGRVGMEIVDLDGWRRLLTSVLGLQEVDGTSDEVRFRADEAAFRLTLRRGERDRLLSTAWEVSGDDDLDRLGEDLRSAGHDVEELSAGEAAERAVGRLLRTVDPAGNTVELYRSPLLSTTPFVSPTGVSFVTGNLGLGHVVLGVSELDAPLRFYRDLLGLRLTDELAMGDTELVFLHCNARHHSLALAQVGSDAGLLHFMLEMASLDQVGTTYERCLETGGVAATLGRHSNDHVVSFYAATPSPWVVEVGWGGLLVDDATWRPARHTGTSLWGHHATAAGA